MEEEGVPENEADAEADAVDEGNITGGTEVSIAATGALECLCLGADGSTCRTDARIASASTPAGRWAADCAAAVAAALAAADDDVRSEGGTAIAGEEADMWGLYPCTPLKPGEPPAPAPPAPPAAAAAAAKPGEPVLAPVAAVLPAVAEGRSEWKR